MKSSTQPTSSATDYRASWPNYRPGWSTTPKAARWPGKWCGSTWAWRWGDERRKARDGPTAHRPVRATPQGEMVCQRHDLQGVIAHLHDLARHLEGLIPDEDYMDKLTRSRDFAGGFAEREKKKKGEA